MNTYRITVAYDGTAYRGWQRQENTELTVQGILERRISEIVGKRWWSVVQEERIVVYMR